MNYLQWVRQELDTPAKKILTLVSLLLVLGQLQRLQITPTIAIYLHDLVIVGWVGYWLTTHRQTIKLNWSGSNLALAGLVMTGYLVALLTSNFQLQALLQLIRLGVYLAFLATIWQAVQIKQLPISFVRYYALAICLLVGWLGLLQYLFLPDTRFLAITGWDDHYFRLISSQFDPGYTGIILVLGWWLLQYFHQLSQKTLVLSLFFTAAIGLTYSRASLLAFGLSLVVGWWLLQQKNVRRNIILSLISLLLIVPILPRKQSEGTDLTRMASVTARTSQFSDYLGWLRPYNLVVGNGLFTQPQSDADSFNPRGDHANVANNWLLTLLSGLGGAGTLLVIWSAGRVLAKVSKRSRLLLVQVLAVLVFGLFNNPFQPFVVLILGLSWVGLFFKLDRNL